MAALFRLPLAFAHRSVTTRRRADVAEPVDARDLKSLGLGHPGSIPGVRTIQTLEEASLAFSLEARSGCQRHHLGPRLRHGAEQEGAPIL